MIGILDIGGGLRGIYGAGVLDRCLDEGWTFDLCIGVSAGSANMAAFLGEQKGRNLRFYAEYSMRKEYMSAQNLLHGRPFLDLDYVYRVLSNSDGEDPLCFDPIAAHPQTLRIPVTETDGSARYFTGADMRHDDYRVIRASCSLPVVCGGCEIDGRTYFDGGIADPVPVEYAFRSGCDALIVILTRPLDAPVDDRIDRAAATCVAPRYPALARALRRKALRYRESLALAKAMQRKGRCLLIFPDDCCGVDTLTRNPDKLRALYHKGFADGEKIRVFLANVHRGGEPCAS